ncbi:hypothetical protein LCGC14_1675690 [marine sediment metagenome]|uniref:Uncharacterized protein n=1 Tax=marine sediment metagenome TaxID=412755 RepID=A0A0F9HQ39_9ZZZZ|nr:hypothetical protein [Desulfobacterales bacterium]
MRNTKKETNVWFVLMAALITFLLSASITQALAVDYGDIPASRIPPNGWQDVQWQDPGGWMTVDVSQN